VNVASGCGYTPQYGELQSFFLNENKRLAVIAIPSADFRNQEKRNDEEILSFCRSYKVTFPILKKTRVKKGEGQDPIFYWLTHAEANGWNDHDAEWNFSKYLIDEEGNLKHVFGPAVAPQEIRRFL
jgi:glutathione peroxidase